MNQRQDKMKKNFFSISIIVICFSYIHLANATENFQSDIKVSVFLKPKYWSVVSGTISYNGIQTGNLFVQLFDSSQTLKINEKTYFWDMNMNSCSYRINVPTNGKYKLVAYIDSIKNIQSQQDECEPYGEHINDIVISTLDPQNFSQINFSLKDPENPYHIIYATPLSITGQPGTNLKCHLNYYTFNTNSDDENLKFFVHFDSSMLLFSKATNMLSYSDISLELIESQINETKRNTHNDGLLLISLNKDILSGISTTKRICTLNFIINEDTDINKQSTIHFSEFRVAENHKFYSSSMSIKTTLFNLDVDGNGIVDALSDGLILIKFLNELTEDISTSIDTKNGTRLSENEIRSYVESGTTEISNNGFIKLDIDCNSKVEALTDGLLILRFLFNITAGNSLINNAVDLKNGKCVSDKVIAENIKKLLP